MNCSLLTALTLGVLVLAAVGAALLLSPSAPVDLSSRQPKAPAAEKSPTPRVPDPGAQAPPPKPAPPVAEPLVVTGHVVDRDGNRVADADVLLYPGQRELPAVALNDADESRRRLVADLFQYGLADIATLRPLGSQPAPIADEKPLMTTRSSETGEFRIDAAPAGAIRLVARKDALSSAVASAHRGARPVELVLLASCVLKGQVTSADDGRALPGAVVRIGLAGQWWNAEAGPDGTYRAEGLPPGMASIVSTHPDFPGDCRRDVALVQGQEKELNIQLSKGLKLTVKVVGADDTGGPGVPLPQALVGLVRMADKMYVSAFTGDDGKAAFELLPTGDYLVNAKKDGWLPAGEQKLTISEEKECELSLDKAVLTTLKVVDERGVPVPGAEVYTGNPDEEFEQGVSRLAGITDEQGEFAFAFDWMGKDAVTYVMKPGFAVAIVTPEDPSGGQPITVSLRAGAALRGRVTGPDDKPVAGAKVYLEVTVEDVQADNLYATVYTDAKGEYRFPWVPLGDVWVQVEADTFDGGDQDFTAEPGAAEYVKDFRLEKSK